MSVDVFALKCGSLPQAKLVGFKGTEYLSRPFELDLYFTLPAGTPVQDAVGADATLLADRQDDRGPMAWHGQLARIRLLHQTAERTLYTALLVPKLWFLRHSFRSHIFTKASEATHANKVDDFTGATLRHATLSDADFKFQVSPSSYPEEEFVCQYRESHLDFLNRWLEREGIYYYFEHPPTESGHARMLLVDSKTAHEPLRGKGKGTVRYYPGNPDDVSAGEALRELHADYQRLPASVLLTDYNYANPAAPVKGEAAVSPNGQGVVRDYGYRVFTEAEANRLAGIKAESIACRELVIHGTGNALFLRAGYTFDLTDQPDEIPAQCLAIEVTHAGLVAGATAEVRRYTGLHESETYRVDLIAIPADVQFRAAQVTAWPRIYSFENGTVCGEANSQYAQIDDDGRYLVRLKFDASDLPDGKASCWVRMMQPHGGAKEGFHFPLRKGTEVMCAFLGGDPDRPFIAGVVPNAQRPSVVTAKNHTHNEIRTGGDSYVVIEDKDGHQYIDVSTPSQGTNLHLGDPRPQDFSKPNSDRQSVPETVSCSFLLNTKGTAGFVVGGDWWQNVNQNLLLEVAGDGTLRYGGIHKLISEGDSNEFYHSHRNTEITSGRTDKVLGGGMLQDVTGGFTHKVKGGSLHDIKGGWTAQASSDIKIDSTGGTVTIHSPTKITLDAPEVKSTAPGKWYKETGFSVELFGSKNAAGIQKFDGTAVTVSVTGSKNEATGMALSATGIKFEKVGQTMSIAGLKVDLASMKYANEPFKLDLDMIGIFNGAFESRAKAFMKIG